MEKGGASVSMDAAASMDMWDWEVLPDQLSSSSHGGGGHGRRVLGAQETEESNLDAAAADMAVDDECKDIGVDVAEEEEEEGKKAGAECVVFRVGKLRVNGIGALCSFGVAAAATVCVFLVGGRLQHHHRQQQQHKIQLQLYGDDKRMQQVVQQTSRLNQAMSSVMGGGGSTRANISFGGYYEGF
uniref:DUF6821 domain-containing protein n=1 Tax=Oryza barthii TaxID=65489 RepID=A0A0D3GNH0_9ORYZ